MVNDLNGRFSFRLHATKALRPGYTHGASDHSNTMNNGNGGAPSSSSSSSSRSSGGRRGRRRDRGLAVPQLPYEPRRPSLETEFRRVEQFGSNALVYCCGPSSLQRDCQVRISMCILFMLLLVTKPLRACVLGRVGAPDTLIFFSVWRVFLFASVQALAHAAGVEYRADGFEL